MLWSESRILRKLDCRDPRVILDSILATDLYGAFSEIYISFSKGRHRKFSRVYYSLYLIFIISIDVMSGLLGVDFSTSEALLALRVMVYFGSFTVLGARPLIFAETLFIIVLAALNAGNILVFGFGWFVVSEKASSYVYWTLTGIRYITLPTALIVSLVDIAVGLCCSSTHISQIANSIRTGRFSSNKRQVRRFNDMNEKVMSDEANKQGTKNGPYWRLGALDVIDLLALFFFTFTNGLAWGRVNKNIIPTLVVIETLELVSTALYTINETQVEPALFAKILSLAHQKVTVSTFV